MSKTKSSNITIVQKSPNVVNVDYQLLIAERDDLLEAEIGYKKRIEKLEKEAAETLKSFDILYNENRILRSKLDTPEGAGVDSVESYNDVFKDREHLRDANRAFKRRIRQIEDDIEREQKKYNELYSKHQLVTQKAQLETEFATRARDDKIGEMEREQGEMEERFRMFLKEREQYEYRVAELDKERNELQNKYDRAIEEKHEFQLRCDVLQEDREKLKQKVTDLEDKIPDPEQEAKDEQQFLSLQAQVVALQIANTDATKKIHNLNEEIRNMEKQINEKPKMADKETSTADNDEQLEADKIANETLAETLYELEGVKKRSYAILKENDKLRSEVADMETQLAEHETTIQSLRKDLELKGEQIEDLSVRVKGGENINEEYLALQEKSKDMIASIGALQNELVNERKNAKLRVMELQNSLNKSTERLHQCEKDKMKLEFENLEIKEEASNQQKVVDVQALELRNMKAQLEQIKAMVEDKTHKYDEMKKAEREAQEELRESRLHLHIARHELDNLKMEKAGHFETLKREMETAKSERKEESEQMRQETLRLREEVKKLKDYEFKITTMDSEIRRLMNRLRMTERYRRMVRKPPIKDPNSEEIVVLKKRQADLEKENNQLLLDRKQLEILKTKYLDLQNNNRRLVEENKRIRGDLDGSTVKVENLEKRFKKMNIKIDDIKQLDSLQRATYVEKTPVDKSKTSNDKDKKRLSSHTTAVIVVPTKKGLHVAQTRTRKKFQRETSTTTPRIDKSNMRSKRPVLPNISKGTSGLQFGKGYKELASGKYRSASKLSLL